MATLYTIGHSTHNLEDFINLVLGHGATDIIDIRTVPKSRHVPWFNKDSLGIALKKENVTYSHMPTLGGLRHSYKDSINAGWRNASFRGFADYMQTPEFYDALKGLNQMLKKKNKVVIMCSEALPWRCHRSLIADAETIRGIHVFHIMGKTQMSPHTLTSFAVVDRSKRPIKVFYPSSN